MARGVRARVAAGWRAAALLGLAGLAAAPLQAAPLPVDEQELRCWLSHTRERTRVNLREPKEVSFSNLRDGYRVASPVLVQFAVRGLGVTPAGTPHEGGGHHHLLINRRLPATLDNKIPFDDFHRHFGQGQTETLIDLPPGRHTLRLLFADHDHRPYFVYSPEIRIEVLGPRAQQTRPKVDAERFAETCARWVEDEVSRPRPPGEPLHVVNLRDGETVPTPFNLRLGVEGLGVCAKGLKAPKCGHFVIDLLARTRVVQQHALVNGATQLNFFVPPGEYRLRLRFQDDAGTDLLPAHELALRVVG